MQIETIRTCLHTELDIIMLIDLCRHNVLPRILRRLNYNEKKLIQDGSVFVYEETETKMKRWTDGKLWSPSRCVGIFLGYREYKPVSDLYDDFKEVPVDKPRSYSMTALTKEKFDEQKKMSVQPDFSAKNMHNTNILASHFLQRDNLPNKRIKKTKKRASESTKDGKKSFKHNDLLDGSNSKKEKHVRSIFIKKNINDQKSKKSSSKNDQSDKSLEITEGLGLLNKNNFSKRNEGIAQNYKDLDDWRYLDQEHLKSRHENFNDSKIRENTYDMPKTANIKDFDQNAYFENPSSRNPFETTFTKSEIRRCHPPQHKPHPIDPDFKISQNHISGHLTQSYPSEKTFSKTSKISGNSIQSTPLQRGLCHNTNFDIGSVPEMNLNAYNNQKQNKGSVMVENAQPKCELLEKSTRTGLNLFDQPIDFQNNRSCILNEYVLPNNHFKPDSSKNGIVFDEKINSLEETIMSKKLGTEMVNEKNIASKCVLRLNFNKFTDLNSDNLFVVKLKMPKSNEFFKQAEYSNDKEARFRLKEESLDSKQKFVYTKQSESPAVRNLMNQTHQSIPMMVDTDSENSKVQSYGDNKPILNTHKPNSYHFKQKETPWDSVKTKHIETYDIRPQYIPDCGYSNQEIFGVHRDKVSKEYIPQNNRYRYLNHNKELIYEPNDNIRNNDSYSALNNSSSPKNHIRYERLSYDEYLSKSVSDKIENQGHTRLLSQKTEDKLLNRSSSAYRDRNDLIPSHPAHGFRIMNNSSVAIESKRLDEIFDNQSKTTSTCSTHPIASFFSTDEQNILYTEPPKDFIQIRNFQSKSHHDSIKPVKEDKATLISHTSNAYYQPSLGNAFCDNQFEEVSNRMSDRGDTIDRSNSDDSSVEMERGSPDKDKECANSEDQMENNSFESPHIASGEKSPLSGASTNDSLNSGDSSNYRSMTQKSDTFVSGTNCINNKRRVDTYQSRHSKHHEKTIYSNDMISSPSIYKNKKFDGNLDSSHGSKNESQYHQGNSTSTNCIQEPGNSKYGENESKSFYDGNVENDDDFNSNKFSTEIFASDRTLSQNSYRDVSGYSKNRSYCYQNIKSSTFYDSLFQNKNSERDLRLSDMSKNSLEPNNIHNQLNRKIFPFNPLNKTNKNSHEDTLMNNYQNLKEPMHQNCVRDDLIENDNDEEKHMYQNLIDDKKIINIDSRDKTSYNANSETNGCFSTGTSLLISPNVTILSEKSTRNFSEIKECPSDGLSSLNVSNIEINRHSDTSSNTKIDSTFFNRSSTTNLSDNRSNSTTQVPENCSRIKTQKNRQFEFFSENTQSDHSGDHSYLTDINEQKTKGYIVYKKDNDYQNYDICRKSDKMNNFEGSNPQQSEQDFAYQNNHKNLMFHDSNSYFQRYELDGRPQHRSKGYRCNTDCSSNIEFNYNQNFHNIDKVGNFDQNENFDKRYEFYEDTTSFNNVDLENFNQNNDSLINCDSVLHKQDSYNSRLRGHQNFGINDDSTERPNSPSHKQDLYCYQYEEHINANKKSDSNLNYQKINLTPNDPTVDEEIMCENTKIPTEKQLNVLKNGLVPNRSSACKQKTISNEKSLYIQKDPQVGQFTKYHEIFEEPIDQTKNGIFERANPYGVSPFKNLLEVDNLFHGQIPFVTPGKEPPVINQKISEVGSRTSRRFPSKPSSKVPDIYNQNGCEASNTHPYKFLDTKPEKVPQAQNQNKNDKNGDFVTNTEIGDFPITNRDNMDFCISDNPFKSEYFHNIDSPGDLPFFEQSGIKRNCFEAEDGNSRFDCYGLLQDSSKMQGEGQNESKYSQYKKGYYQSPKDFQKSNEYYEPAIKYGLNENHLQNQNDYPRIPNKCLSTVNSKIFHEKRTSNYGFFADNSNIFSDREYQGKCINASDSKSVYIPAQAYKAANIPKSEHIRHFNNEYNLLPNSGQCNYYDLNDKYSIGGSQGLNDFHYGFRNTFDRFSTNNGFENSGTLKELQHPCDFEDPLFAFNSQGTVRIKNSLKSGTKKDLFKKTLTATLKDKTYHIIAYETLEDELTGKCCLKWHNKLRKLYEEFIMYKATLKYQLLVDGNDMRKKGCLRILDKPCNSQVENRDPNSAGHDYGLVISGETSDLGHKNLTMSGSGRSDEVRVDDHLDAQFNIDVYKMRTGEDQINDCHNVRFDDNKHEIKTGEDRIDSCLDIRFGNDLYHQNDLDMFNGVPMNESVGFFDKPMEGRNAYTALNHINYSYLGCNESGDIYQEYTSPLKGYSHFGENSREAEKDFDRYNGSIYRHNNDTNHRYFSNNHDEVGHRDLGSIANVFDDETGSHYSEQMYIYDQKDKENLEVSNRSVDKNISKDYVMSSMKEEGWKDKYENNLPIGCGDELESNKKSSDENRDVLKAKMASRDLRDMMNMDGFGEEVKNVKPESNNSPLFDHRRLIDYLQAPPSPKKDSK